MIQLDREGTIPMYEQIYRHLRKSIELGVYEVGQRLPSIRSLAAENGVSKITVEQAYLQLAAEGYIKAHKKSPYEVLDVGQMGMLEHITEERPMVRQEMVDTLPIQYNFAEATMDPEGFDFSRWKRYIGYVLRTPQRLMMYGDGQGEIELRKELAKYLGEARGVAATDENILVSSGTQFSMQLIGSLLKNQGCYRVAVPTEERLVRYVLENQGFEIITVDEMREDLHEILEREQVQAYYCTPSHASLSGGVMTIRRRQELLQWAERNNAYIIEDDFDSELRYYGKPISSLQGLDRSGCVIYMGAPSKVLPPSIRLSYIILPPLLCAIYKERKGMYRQSASVMEQLVWAQYMRDGEWNKQIRRLRKHYLDKGKYMVDLLRRYIGEWAEVEAPQGGIYVALRLKKGFHSDELYQKALTAGCLVRQEGDTIFLSLSGIGVDRLEAAIIQLREAWKGK